MQGDLCTGSAYFVLSQNIEVSICMFSQYCYQLPPRRKGLSFVSARLTLKNSHSAASRLEQNMARYVLEKKKKISLFSGDVISWVEMRVLTKHLSPVP